MVHTDVFYLFSIVARIYPCVFCAVKFSSLSTLEAHVAYYCSKKSTVMGIPSEDSPQNDVMDSSDSGGADKRSPERGSLS